jgi:predicted nucleic acid-binding protein
VIVDTSALLAYFDAAERDRQAVSRVIGSTIVTLDRRQFDVLRPVRCGRFTVMP